MGDPEVNYRRLTEGDPARIREAARPMASARNSLAEAIESLDAGKATALGGWQGEAADSARHTIELGGNAGRTAQTRIAAAGQILDTLADRYTQVRAAADEAIAVWRSRVPGAEGEAALAAQVNGVLDTLRNEWAQELRTQTGKLNQLEPAFQAAAGGQPGWANTAQAGALRMPARGTDPKQVAQWWAGLSETERDQLLANRFDELGRLRGLPSDVLDDANTRRVQVDQARFGSQRVQLDNQLESRARELGLDPMDTEALRDSNDPKLASLLDQQATLDRRLDNANAAGQRIAEAEQLAQQHGIDDTYVLSYDHDGPGLREGTLAIAFGNPDTADHVALLVPGTTATLDNGFPNGSAANVWTQMHGDAPDAHNATIAWLDYDAPTWDMSVVSAHDAIEGGALLKADVDGFHAAAQVPQQFTVIGHSYGSTVVGYAGLDGLKADDIVFVGSPGVGASSADQFLAGHDHVWAGAVEHDPVVQLTSGDWFTKDGTSVSPYDSTFGAHVFGTQNDTHLHGAHSTYYDAGSESLRNLGSIATGHYADVTGQHWLDSPVPPHWPGSDLPVVGPAVDFAANSTKELGDIVHQSATGLWNAGGDLLHGDLSGAAADYQHMTGENRADLTDWFVGSGGDLFESGHQQLEMDKRVWDHTVGRLF